MQMVSGSAEEHTIRDDDALVVVDVQIDFLPGGKLAVPKGDEVIASLNRVIAAFVRRGRPIFATRDWHPADHCSFQARGGPWPPHCVAGSTGAEFAPGLRLPVHASIVAKATTADHDAYSGFEGTDLERSLRALGVHRIWVGGLATDYCVLNTVRDARRLGFEVELLTDCVRAVDVQAGDGERAQAEMLALGARPVASSGLE